METLMYYFLLDLPLAATIWSALIVVAILALAGVASRSNRARPRQPTVDSAPPTGVTSAPAPPGLTATATDGQPGGTPAGADATADLRRYAEEIAVAARRAEATAGRLRERWLAAQDEVDAILRDYLTAQDVLRRSAAARAFPTPPTPRTPAEYAARERYLHRSVVAAYWRGELSAEQLYEALAHRTGWDPTLHPFDQDVAIKRAARDRLATVHQAAARREQAAWQAADSAVVAAHSLRREAAAAQLALAAPATGSRRGTVRRRPRPVWDRRTRRVGTRLDAVRAH